MAVDAKRAHASANALSLLRPYLVAARPLQWSKNLLLFAGIVFAKQYGELDSWIASLVAFTAYCAASSAAYLVNDVADANRDRMHPTKRSRPLAAGTISRGGALVAAAALAGGAIGLSLLLGLGSTGLLAGFLILQASYSLRLKHVLLVDVLTISALFVVRAAAGALAIDVWLSPWLVLCSGLLALFLALAKRRAELAVATADSSAARPVLGSYSLPLLDQLITIVTAATLSAYSLYTFTASESAAMMLTIPIVVYGLFRYLQLVHAPAAHGGEPERTLVTDGPLVATSLLWACVTVLILAVD